MLRPARMVQLNVLVLDSDVDRTTTEMIRSGLVQVASVTDLEPWAQEELEATPDEYSQVLAQIENLARSVAERLGVGPEVVSEALAFQPFHPDEARRELEEINQEVKATVAARDAAKQKLAALQQTRRQLPLDAWAKFGIDIRSGYTLLEVVTGRLPEKNLDALSRLLASIPNVILTFAEQKGTAAVMVIVLKKDRDALERAIQETGLERLPVREAKEPLSDEMMAQLDERIREAEEEIKSAESAVAGCRDSHLAALQRILSQVSLQRLKSQAKSQFRKSARTYLISGWTPRRSREKVVEAIKKACENRCLIEEQSAEQMLSQRGGNVDVPVLFDNPRALKPFEMLVSSYGRPTYTSIDPTVVVAPTFLLMYGAMFGDVGQGLVMAILGALVARSKKVSESIRRIGELFVWCGCSATLFGFLYGSVFGFGSVPDSASVLPYRGFEPLGKLGSFLNLALYFGIGLLSIGMLFNAIAAITKKDWAAAFLDRTGLMGVAFYWFAVWGAMQFLSVGSISGTVLSVLIVMPLLASFLKRPLEKLIHPASKPPEEGIGAYVRKSLAETLGTYFENLLTFLSNTVSFVRLAAFAIAHAALFIAVFSLAEVLKGGGLGLPILVHIIGNAGMMALEGLVVCVQALRLEYYEFFGKFFQVGGTAFTPMKLTGPAP